LGGFVVFGGAGAGRRHGHVEDVGTFQVLCSESALEHTVPKGHSAVTSIPHTTSEKIRRKERLV
jgi:hypothetical protein